MAEANKTIQKAFKALPYEAFEQIDGVMKSENINMAAVDMPFLVKEVEWSVEKLGMDAAETADPEDRKNAKKEQAACRRWLKKWRNVE